MYLCTLLFRRDPICESWFRCQKGNSPQRRGLRTGWEGAEQLLNELAAFALVMNIFLLLPLWLRLSRSIGLAYSFSPAENKWISFKYYKLDITVDTVRHFQPFPADFYICSYNILHLSWRPQISRAHPIKTWAGERKFVTTSLGIETGVETCFSTLRKSYGK